MTLKARPANVKADLADQLRDLGGDDYTFWGDGSVRVDDESPEYKRYAKVTVRALRSEVDALASEIGQEIAARPSLVQ